MQILVVDDEPNIRRALRIALEATNHVVTEADGVPAALKAADRRSFDVAFLDLRLRDQSGLDLITPLLDRNPRLAVIIVTAHASIDTAVEAMRRGAFDYLEKPFTPAVVRGVLERASRDRALRDRLADLEERIRDEVPEIDLAGRDEATARVLEIAKKVATTEAAILIRGENGTGKGVLARAVHDWSARSKGPFVTVGCPNLGADLLESELFGHVRGAFTGAVADTQGKVAAAEGGTLFLDEIGDLPLGLQPKLLRFLQEKQYERVGETKTRTADVRVLAATNRDVEAAVREGRFREDLLYRLNVIEIMLPPLRVRSDRFALAEHLLAFFSKQTKRNLKGFTPEARASILQYPWPGNIRELRNAVERATILASGPEIGLADLPERVGRASEAGPTSTSTTGIEVGGRCSLEQLELEHMKRVLAAAPNLDAAAEILGIDPSTLFRKRKKHGL